LDRRRQTEPVANDRCESLTLHDRVLFVEAFAISVRGDPVDDLTQEEAGTFE
jgi:hypothetical protein